jgi:hypothetical protein
MQKAHIFFFKSDWDMLATADDDLDADEAKPDEDDFRITAEINEVLTKVGCIVDNEPYEFEDKWTMYVHDLGQPNERPAVDHSTYPIDVKTFESEQELFDYAAKFGLVRA